MTPVHATCVAIGERGVLITGASGSGKSDLALRLIDRGARLVSDDYTVLAVSNGRLVASAPPTIAGRIEARGIGIVPVEPLPSVIVALLVVAGVPERMPVATGSVMVGIEVPMIHLSLLEASAPLKVELMLRTLTP